VQRIFVCNVGVPTLLSWIVVSWLSQLQLGGFPPTFLSQQFDWIKHDISECDPLEYSLKEGNILWALMSEVHIQVGTKYAQW
jgi:hypothetical protein